MKKANRIFLFLPLIATIRTSIAMEYPDWVLKNSNTDEIILGCPCCNENLSLRENISTNCGHIFHRDCLTNALQKYQACPFCYNPQINDETGMFITSIDSPPSTPEEDMCFHCQKRDCDEKIIVSCCNNCLHYACFIDAWQHQKHFSVCPACRGKIPIQDIFNLYQISTPDVIRQSVAEMAKGFILGTDIFFSASRFATTSVWCALGETFCSPCVTHIFTLIKRRKSNHPFFSLSIATLINLKIATKLNMTALFLPRFLERFSVGTCQTTLVFGINEFNAGNPFDQEQLRSLRLNYPPIKFTRLLGTILGLMTAWKCYHPLQKSIANNLLQAGFKTIGLGKYLLENYDFQIGKKIINEGLSFVEGTGKYLER